MYDRTFENQYGRSLVSGNGDVSPVSRATDSYALMSSRFHRPSGRERRSSTIWNEYRIASPLGSMRFETVTVVPVSCQVPMKKP